MRDLNSSSLSGLISQYLHGNWSFFNNDRPHLGVLDADAKAIALILHDLTPGSVFHQETELSSRILLTSGLSSSLLSCRQSLVVALSLAAPGENHHRCTNCLCSLFIDLADLLSTVAPSCRFWIESYLQAHINLFKASLIAYMTCHDSYLAGHLPRKVTVVLGMHRSGTSALTGMLHQAGLSAPIDALGATESNPYGYWESSFLVEISNQLLKNLGSDWSQVYSLPSGWYLNSLTTDWLADFLHALPRLFPSGEHLVIKDPRLCVLLEPLLPCFQSELMDVTYLLMLRSPIEVIASLNKSEGTDFKTALLLWIASVLGAERFTREEQRTVVTYSQLLARPEDVLESCRSLWGEMSLGSPSIQPSAFINSSLHRQKQSDLREDFIVNYPSLSPLLSFAERIYDLLSGCSADDQMDGLDSFNRRWLYLRSIADYQPE